MISTTSWVLLVLGSTIHFAGPPSHSEGPAPFDWRNAELEGVLAGIKLTNGESGPLCMYDDSKEGELTCDQALVRRAKPDTETYGRVTLLRVLSGELDPSSPGPEIVLQLVGNPSGGNYSATIFLVYRMGGAKPQLLDDLEFDSDIGRSVDDEKVVLKGGALYVTGYELRDDDPTCCPSLGFKTSYRLAKDEKSGRLVMRPGRIKTWRLPPEK